MSYTPSQSFVISSGLASRRAKNPNFNPLYRQIKELILKSLSSGDWMPGSMIPSEAELAARFGVSQGTVRKAVDELSAENLLTRLQGKGTFVTSHSDAPYHFLCLRPDDGDAEQKYSKPISCESIAADAKVAEALAIPVNDPVFRIERILLLNGQAAAFDQIFLVAESFIGLSLDMLNQELDQGKSSLYGMLEERFKVRMTHVEEKVRAVKADAAVAKSLTIPVGEPILLVERTAYTYGDKAVEWRRSFYRTDRYYYLNKIS